MTMYKRREESFTCRLGEFTLLRFQRCLWVWNMGPEVVRGEPIVDLNAVLDGMVPGEGADGMLLRSTPFVPNARISFRRGCIIYTPRHYKRYFITLARGTFDDYLARFSAKTRSSLRRKLKKLEQVSGDAIDFRQYCSPREMDEFYRHARDVSRRTYQERMFDMGLPADTVFYEAMCQAATQGQVRAYLIFLEGRPLAYLYCPCIDGVVEYQYLGYLQDYKHLSPGTVLLLRALEALFADPDARVFDFTEGGKEGGHKDFFANDSRDCADVYVLPVSIPNVLLVLSQTLCDQVSGHAGRALERLGLKRRIKAALRLARGRA